MLSHARAQPQARRLAFSLFRDHPEKTITTGVAGLNDATGLPVIAGTCGTCHDSPNVGDHSFPAPLNIGVADLTNPLGVDYLPVITLRNKITGAIVQTTDPGRALVTGKRADIRKVEGPILRGLSSRAMKPALASRTKASSRKSVR